MRLKKAIIYNYKQPVCETEIVNLTKRTIVFNTNNFQVVNSYSLEESKELLLRGVDQLAKAVTTVLSNQRLRNSFDNKIIVNRDFHSFYNHLVEDKLGPYFEKIESLKSSRPSLSSFSTFLDSIISKGESISKKDLKNIKDLYSKIKSLEFRFIENLTSLIGLSVTLKLGNYCNVLKFLKRIISYKYPDEEAHSDTYLLCRLSYAQ